MAETKKSNRSMQTFLLSVLAGILLVIASMGVWVNNYLFNTPNFSSVVTASLTSENSRQAIAQGITDRVFEDRPALKNAVGDTSVKIVSGLLGTTQARNGIDVVVSRLQTAVTTNNPQSVAINLSGIKNILTQLYDVSANLGREPRVNPESIPNEIILIDKDQIPNFILFGTMSLWVAPLAFIVAIATLAYPYLKNRRRYKTIMIIEGACVAVIGLLALLIGPLFRPLLLGNIQTEAGRTVVGNLYNDLISTFNQQTTWIIVVGLFVVIVGAGLIAWQAIKGRKELNSVLKNENPELHK